MASFKLLANLPDLSPRQIFSLYVWYTVVESGGREGREGRGGEEGREGGEVKKGGGREGGEVKKGGGREGGDVKKGGREVREGGREGR